MNGTHADSDFIPMYPTNISTDVFLGLDVPYFDGEANKGEYGEYMYLCKSCHSEWHDDTLHPGTCGNCGVGGGDAKAKRRIEVLE